VGTTASARLVCMGMEKSVQVRHYSSGFQPEGRLPKGGVDKFPRRASLYVLKYLTNA